MIVCRFLNCFSLETAKFETSKAAQNAKPLFKIKKIWGENFESCPKGLLSPTDKVLLS
jgi:hypothetical protein